MEVLRLHEGSGRKPVDVHIPSALNLPIVDGKHRGFVPGEIHVTFTRREGFWPFRQASVVEKSRPVTLFIKQTIRGADSYIENWKALRSLGIPTMTTLRKIDYSLVALVDMTADGSHFYGKSNLRDYERKNKRGEVTPEHTTNKLFLEATQGDNYTALLEEVDTSIAKATQGKLLLPLDETFELLMSPQGKKQLVLWDVDEVIPDIGFDRKFIEDSNKTAKERFIVHVREQRKYLLERQTASTIIS